MSVDLIAADLAAVEALRTASRAELLAALQRMPTYQRLHVRELAAQLRHARPNARASSDGEGKQP